MTNKKNLDPDEIEIDERSQKKYSYLKHWVSDCQRPQLPKN